MLNSKLNLLNGMQDLNALAGLKILIISVTPCSSHVLRKNSI
jgi:hypothetical protein